MLVCGVKVTHDGGIAVVEGSRLVLAVEAEKLRDNPRYSALRDTSQISEMLRGFGLAPREVDQYVIDGWGALAPDDPASSHLLSRNETEACVSDGGREYVLRLARYREHLPFRPVDELRPYTGLWIEGEEHSYVSSVHTAGHVLAAYCTSPFAREQEDSYVLVWDGGIYPHLYYVAGLQRRIEPLGPLFRLFGNAYAMFARRFPPFHGADEHGLATAGKVMAFIAGGMVQQPLLRFLKVAAKEKNTLRYDFPRKLARMADEKFSQEDWSPADFMATFHAFLGNLLCATLEHALKQRSDQSANLCLSGGCALNIKWNSAIRESGLFRAVYVPPFPNDSGNAIGAACSMVFRRNSTPHLDWSVRAGPQLLPDTPPEEWARKPFSLRDLARLLAEEDEPVVFLHGRAEVGPRALGGRSILASPRNAAMRARLNEIKGREQYRPVAPVCMEDRAAEVFAPGSRDPFMLFEHRIRADWLERIPAAAHVDGTARLQTVSQEDDPVLYALLREYASFTGIPVLCNTSANHSGRGFFPSARSAAEWGRTKYIWSDGVLYTKASAWAIHPS